MSYKNICMYFPVISFCSLCCIGFFTFYFIFSFLLNLVASRPPNSSSNISDVFQGAELAASPLQILTVHFIIASQSSPQLLSVHQIEEHKPPLPIATLHSRHFYCLVSTYTYPTWCCTHGVSAFTVFCHVQPSKQREIIFWPQFYTHGLECRTKAIHYK